MPYDIVRGDITKFHTDAIVCPTDSFYSHGGGTDKAIHLAAGEKLEETCEMLPDLQTGTAVITPGFDLPARYVIHTVGPVYRGGTCGERALLRSSYRSCLALADAFHLSSIAIPLISSGTFGFPKDQVLHIALDEIGGYLLERASRRELDVKIVVYSKDACALAETISKELNMALSEAGTDDITDSAAVYMEGKRSSRSKLEDLIKHGDASFAERLYALIQESGMKPSECYQRANVSKQVYSKIMSGQTHPKRGTAVALGMALKADFDTMQQLIEPLGYTIANTMPFDIIIRFCMEHGIYDVIRINEILYEYDQELLGSSAN